MSRFSGWLTGCGGVEETTSGSMAEGGRGDGGGSLGRGNSVWTIWARRQRAAALFRVVRDWHAGRDRHRVASGAQPPARGAIRRCRRLVVCKMMDKRGCEHVDGAVASGVFQDLLA